VTPLKNAAAPVPLFLAIFILVAVLSGCGGKGSGY
jgi:hypothetical protein